MKTRLRNWWEALRTSLWFIPGALITLALGLGSIMTWVDRSFGDSDLLTNSGWLYMGDAANTLAILTTIASSIMTVTGVSFSVTIVTLTLASSQFGPRLLRNFMSSVVSQLVLGSLMGTFVYCLIIMRTVGSSWKEGVAHPSIAVAVLLALFCVSALIYFVHHVASSIQADNLIARVYGELEEAIEALSDRHDGGDDQVDSGRAEYADASICVPAPRSGYLLAIASGAIATWAAKENLHIRFLVKPGSFVAKDGPLILVESKVGSDCDSEKVCEALLERVYLGKQRSPEQDFEYTISQIVEIAVRALSPGINDPKTAETCIEYLSAGLSLLAGRALPSHNARDEEGVLRVIVPPATFAAALDAAFDGIRYVCADHPKVMLRLAESLARIAARIDADDDRREAVEIQANLLAHTISQMGKHEKEQAASEAALQEINAGKQNPRSPQGP